VIQFLDKKGEPTWMAPEKLPIEDIVEVEPIPAQGEA